MKVQNNKTNKQPSLLSQIFNYAGQYKGSYIFSIVLAVAGVACRLIPFFLIGNMVSMLISGVSTFGSYLPICLWIGVFWTGGIIFHTVSTGYSHKATFQVLANIRKRMCDKLAKAPLGAVLGIPSGSLKSTMVERVDSMETTLAHVIPEFTANTLAPVGMFIIMLFIDWRMALISLVSFPAGFIFFVFALKDHKVRQANYIAKTKVLNDTAVEYINGIEVIKAFGKSESSYGKFTIAAKEAADSCIEWMRDSLWGMAGSMAIAPATLVTVLPIGGIFFATGSLPADKFIQIIILSVGLVAPIITSMGYLDDIAKAGVIFGEVNDIVSMEEMSRPEVTEKKPAGLDIILKDVHFAYEEKEVLHGVNMLIPEGKMTAIVGPSGSGKSTVTKLIASFWDVTSGSISIGGTDIRFISREDLNRMIAYVAQDNYLFDMTVRENIRMGRPEATDEEVEEIARLSGCHDFIMSLESGYETIAGGAGGHLSGGERQRITIARAMMKGAPIVILDEATAYTDPENEALIQESVAKLVKGKTLIVIAHRLSTIADADNIVVVNDGLIDSQGTHGELLAMDGVYKKMWDAHMSAKDG